MKMKLMQKFHDGYRLNQKIFRNSNIVQPRLLGQLLRIRLLIRIFLSAFWFQYVF